MNFVPTGGVLVLRANLAYRVPSRNLWLGLNSRTSVSNRARIAAASATVVQRLISAGARARRLLVATPRKGSGPS